jgi:predicted nucleic acid-binding Zn ribbon protein
MPYYDYVCSECGKTFEIFQKMDEEARVLTHGDLAENYELTESRCRGHLERKVSTSALKFVGPGFYVNDYPKKKV